MKTQKKLSQSILIVAIITTAILMVPLVAMQFTPEVDWSALDFALMGVLIFGTGLAFVLITRGGANIIFRAGAGLTLGATLLMIWANLGVGLIGSGPNAGNLLYIVVLIAGFAFALRSGFTPRGMQRATYAMAVALALHACIALITGMQNYPGSSVAEILGVNGFFAALFVVAGLLFNAAQKPAAAHPVK